MEATIRRRNPRGSGDQLRDEILRAATQLIDKTEDESKVTLRSIARAAGIAAPSVYAHFPDRDAIIAAIMEHSWQLMVEAIAAQASEGQTPRDRLVRGCEAYLSVAQRHPLRYAMMTRATATTPAARKALNLLTVGLNKCRAERGDATTPVVAKRIAAALSVGLHGAAMLNLTDVPSLWLNAVSVVDVVHTLVDGAIAQTDPSHPGGQRRSATKGDPT